MKFRDDEGNEYEVKKKESANWIHVAIVVSVIIAPSNIIFHGFYIFGDIAMFGLLWFGKTVIEMFLNHDEKGEFTSPLRPIVIYFMLMFVWFFIVLFAFEKFGIMHDIR